MKGVTGFFDAAIDMDTKIRHLVPSALNGPLVEVDAHRSAAGFVAVASHGDAQLLFTFPGDFEVLVVSDLMVDVAAVLGVCLGLNRTGE